MAKLKVITLSFCVDFHGDITDVFFEQSSQGGMAASTLIQTIPALKALEQFEASNKVLSLHEFKTDDIKLYEKIDACFVGKLSANTESIMKRMTEAHIFLLSHLKPQGTKNIITYCDNHIESENPTLRHLYKRIFELADILVFPSKSLYKIARKYIPSTSKTMVIHDHCQVRQNFNFCLALTNNERWKLIWFGSKRNLNYLLNAHDRLISSSILKSQEHELTIVASKDSIQQLSKIFEKKIKLTPNWSCRLVSWDPMNQPEQLENELKRAHISLIPSDPYDNKKAGVSHNRLVDSIRGGCIAIASPLDSYKDLKKICLLGNDFPLLLKYATDNYHRLAAKYNSCRDTHLAEFSPDSIINSWKNLWELSFGNQSRSFEEYNQNSS
tara:strand:- start:2121 stop:3272 length:1152 start_codon:yes stop_codon:yes gene_type:complete